MADPRNYVRGDINAPKVCEIRLPGKIVLETREGCGAPIAELERIAHENGAEWAECEAVSGFYSWCLGRAENYAT